MLDCRGRRAYFIVIAQVAWRHPVYREQRYRVDCFAIRLRVQRSVVIKVGLEARRAREGQFDALGLGQRSLPQLARGA